MRRYHPEPASEVPISLRLHYNLNTASMLSKSGLETWEIAEQAIDEWLAKNEPGSIHMPSFAGVQWKKLFLPNGRSCSCRMAPCMAAGGRLAAGAARAAHPQPQADKPPSAARKPRPGDQAGQARTRIGGVLPVRPVCTSRRQRRQGTVAGCG